MVDSYDPTKNRYAVYAVNGSTRTQHEYHRQRHRQQGQHGRRRGDAAAARGGAGVQHQPEPLLRRERPQRGRGAECGDQVRHEPVPRQPCTASSAPRRFRPTTTSRSRAASRSRTTAANSTADRIGGPIRQGQGLRLLCLRGSARALEHFGHARFLRRADAGARWQSSNPTSSRSAAAFAHHPDAV